LTPTVAIRVWSSIQVLTGTNVQQLHVVDRDQRIILPLSHATTEEVFAGVQLCWFLCDNNLHSTVLLSRG